MIASAVGGPDALGDSDGDRENETVPSGAEQTGVTFDGSLVLEDAKIESADGTISQLAFRLEGEVSYDAVSGDPDTLGLYLFAGRPGDTVEQSRNEVGRKSFELEEEGDLAPVTGETAYEFTDIDLLEADALSTVLFSAPEEQPRERTIIVSLVAQLKRNEEAVIETTLSEEFTVTVVNLQGTLNVSGEGEIISNGN